MFKQTKVFVAGIVLGAILATSLGVVFAAPIERTITALYNNIKIYVDGNLISPKDANGDAVEPFIYNGTTYLPVRAIGEALGKMVEWDGNTQSVFIGNKPGAVPFLVELFDMYDSSYGVEEFSGGDSVSMAGTKHYNGVRFGNLTVNESNYAMYNLNGQYSELSGVVGRIDQTTEYDTVVNIYGDGKLITTIDVPWDALPQPFKVDIRGVLQLKLEFQRASDGSWSYDVRTALADLKLSQ